MNTPTVTELSALSAHQRTVALVRWSLIVRPEREPRPGADGPRPLA